MAMAPDFVVEVRDINFARIGQIAPEFLDLQFVEVFRSVGSWQLKLPASHPLLEDLKTKGAGIIVTDRSTDRVFSGRVRACELSQDATDPDGTWLIAGVDDNVVAAASVVYPDPTHAAGAQASAYWASTADGETVMKSLVRYNIADLALPARKYPWLTSAANLTRGSIIGVSLRFDVLADALTDAGIKSNLGWRFYQSGAGVVFDVFTPQDKTDLIRLDIRNGGLASAQLGWTAPAASEVLVLGQGEGADRTVLPVTTAESLAEATAWGLRWESAKDQRNTDDPAELLQAGEAVLSEQGSTINSLKIAPSDAPNQKLGEDWWLGDLVAVIIADQPTEATVTQVATSITAEGAIRQVTVGDPVGFDWEAKVGTKLQNHEQRVSSLETTVEAGTTWDGIVGKPARLQPTGALVTDWNTATEVGFYYGTGAANAPTPSDYFAGTVEYDGVHNRVIQTLHVPAVGLSAARQREEYRRVFASPSWTAWTRMDLPEDTGWVNIAGSVTPGSGWSFPSGLYARRVGNMVSIECPNAAVASSTFTVPAHGNITNQTICTGVPTQFRPGRAQGLGTGPTGRGHGIHISASGLISLPWVVPVATQTGDLANSAESFSFGSTFLAA